MTTIIVDIYILDRKEPIRKSFTYNDTEEEPVTIEKVGSDMQRLAGSGFFHEFSDGTHCYFTPPSILEVHWKMS